MLQIDNRQELLITLQSFWLLDKLEGAFRFLRIQDFETDPRFMNSLSDNDVVARQELEKGLERAVERGALLKTIVNLQGNDEACYFLNSPKGRAAVRAISSGQWSPAEQLPALEELPEELPNIFRLYEENIGPITPMLAESLGEAEDTYPLHWIEEAIRIAVERNKRSWRYAEAILKKWHVEGRDAKKENTQDRRDSAENRQRYVEGDYADFIEH